MKKSLIKFFVIVLISFLSCGCSNKEILSDNVFANILKKHDFELKDITSHFKEQNLNKFIIGKSLKDYQIEYIVFYDKDSALEMVGKNVNLISNSFNITPNKILGNNFTKYTFATKYNYYIISQVENTVIYAEAPIEYMEEINAILTEMDY